jgi:hypothetical protein
MTDKIKRLEKYQKVNGKLHLYLLYLIAFPLMSFVVCAIFNFKFYTNLSFLIILLLIGLYFFCIYFFKWRIDNLKKKIK